MNDLIKILNSLEDSVVLIDRATERVKHEKNRQKGGFIGALLAPLTALCATSNFFSSKISKWKRS